MRGDMNKLIEQVNLVTEKLADRIVALEDKIQLMEEEKSASKPATKRVSEKKEAETEAA
jgi:hypothetical protein